MSTAVASRFAGASTLNPAFRQAASTPLNRSATGLNPNYFASSTPSTKLRNTQPVQEDDSDEESEDEDEGPTSNPTSGVSIRRQTALDRYDEDDEDRRIIESMDEGHLPILSAYRGAHGEINEDAYDTDLEYTVEKERKSRQEDLWRRVINNDEDYAHITASPASSAPSRPKSSMRSVYKESPGTMPVQTGRIKFHSDIVTSVLERDNSIRGLTDNEKAWRGREGLCPYTQGGYTRSDISKRIAPDHVRKDNHSARQASAGYEGGAGTVRKMGDPHVPVSKTYSLDDFKSIRKYGTSTSLRRRAPEEGTDSHARWTKQEASFRKKKLVLPEELASEFPSLAASFTRSGAESIGDDLWLSQWKGFVKDGKRLALDKSTKEQLSELLSLAQVRAKTKEEVADAHIEQQTSSMSPDTGLRLAPVTLEEAAQKGMYGLSEGVVPSVGWEWTEPDGQKAYREFVDLATASELYPLLSRYPTHRLAQDAQEVGMQAGTSTYAKWAKELTEYRRDPRLPTVVLTQSQMADYNSRMASSLRISVTDKITGCTGGNCGLHCELHGNGLRRFIGRSKDKSQKQRWTFDSIDSSLADTFIAHSGTQLLAPESEWRPHLSRSQRLEQFGTVDRNTGLARMPSEETTTTST